MNFTTEQVSALNRALAAIRTWTRLEEIRGEHSYLTAPQAEDHSTAVRSWNEAVAALPELRLPALDHAWTADELARAVRTLEGFQKMAEGAAFGAEVRNRIGAVSDPASGNPPGRPTATDQIRDMLASRERQADFVFPESETIRSLPWLGGEDDASRSISNFANGTSLYVSDFAARVAAYARTISPYIGLGTVVNSDNGRPLVVPTLTGDVTVYTPGEGTAITPADPTLGSVTVTPAGFKALTYINREAFDDAEINLTDVLARSHARAIGLAFGSAFTTTVLTGITNGGTAVPAGGAGTGTPTFIGYEDLIDLEYGRAAPYRESGVWVMSNGMIKKARKYRDSTGAYLWQPNLAAGQPQTFDGHAVYEDPYLAAPASATKSVLFGDLAAALVLKATPIRVELSSDFLFDKDQIAIKSVQRISGAVQDAAGAAYMVSFNT
ncbi:MAG: phage major capsid protein [Chloroflexi bacterium]|nr:phage major capsid protein [Chloroflexota bacterium]